MSRLLSVLSPRRRWRKLLWALFVVVACGLAFMAWAIHYANRTLNEAIAEAERDDPHWQMMDLNERRAKVADANNSALVVQAGKRKCPGDTFLSQHFDAEELFWEYPNALANAPQKTALNDYLKLYAASLVEYRKLKDMPNGRYPLSIAPNIISTPNPHILDLRDACQALRWEAYDRMEAGDANGAADAIVSALNAARSIGDEPFGPSVRVRLFCDAIVAAICERLLSQMEADDATLARIQSVIESELHEPIFLQGIRGQRAFCYANSQYLKEHPIHARLPRRAPGMWGTRMCDWLVVLPGTIASAQAESLKHMNEAVRIAKIPYEQHVDAFNAWDQKTKRLSDLAQQLTPSLSPFSQHAICHQAQFRCLQIAIAAERYRQQRRSWPEKLDDLLQAKLVNTVPLDPFNGKPLLWKTVDDGRLIYSINKNRIDDGGNFPRVIVNNEDNSDVGFRLYDPDKRRQSPRPIKAKQPTEDEK